MPYLSADHVALDDFGELLGQRAEIVCEQANRKDHHQRRHDEFIIVRRQDVAVAHCCDCHSGPVQVVEILMHRILDILQIGCRQPVVWVARKLEVDFAHAAPETGHQMQHHEDVPDSYCETNRDHSEAELSDKLLDASVRFSSAAQFDRHQREVYFGVHDKGLEKQTERNVGKGIDEEPRFEVVLGNDLALKDEAAVV